MIKLNRVATSISLATLLALAGCTGGKGTGSNLPLMNPQAAAVTVNIGDSPDERFAALGVAAEIAVLDSVTGRPNGQICFYGSL